MSVENKENQNDEIIVVTGKQESFSSFDKNKEELSVLNKIKLELNKLKSELNPYNRGVEDYSDKGNFKSAYAFAKKNGEEEFMWNGNRFSTKEKGNERDILVYQKNKFNYESNYSNSIRNRLANNTLPNSAISFGKVISELGNVISNKKERGNKNTRAVAFYRNYLGEVREEDKKWLKESKYKPSDYDPQKHGDKRYFSPLSGMQEKDINYYLDNSIKYQIIRKNNKNKSITDPEDSLVEREGNLPYDYESRQHGGDLIPDLQKMLERDLVYEKRFDDLVKKGYSGYKANKTLTKEMGYNYGDYDEIDTLGGHNIRFREDEKGRFMEIRDTFDLDKYDKITKGKPFEVYDRIYYKDYGNKEYKQMFFSDKELKNLDINKRNFDVLELQKELLNRGYGLLESKKENGNFDGILGDETKNAILDWKSKNK